MSFRKKLILTIFSLLCIVALITLVVKSCKKPVQSENLTKVTLNEVAHSIFYAPMYVAINEGYFEEEGIDLNLVTGFGADKTMTALISGEADIGFMDSESTIYAYLQGAKDYAVNFAGLTQRAGNFLVAREKIDNFSWDMLKGKTVIGGRDGGMPEMVLEYILKDKEIDPENDLEIIKNIDFGLTSGAFSGGTGDYTVEFEPNATALEKEGCGYVVASLGVESGYVPYTAFCAKKSFIEKNPELLEGFVRALQKGLDYVKDHKASEIAVCIAPSFPDTAAETISIIVDRYKSQDTWKETTYFTEDSFNLLCNILISAGEIDKFPLYSDLVDNTFSIR